MGTVLTMTDMISCQSVSLKAFSCNSDVCVKHGTRVGSHPVIFPELCKQSPMEFSFFFQVVRIFINALGGITSSIKFIEMIISIWYRHFKVVNYNSISRIYLHHEA